MNPLKLKEGQLITCKEGYYMGTFSKVPFSDFVSPYTPWLTISSLDFTGQNAGVKNGEWMYGAGEVLVYLGRKTTQLSIELVELPDETQYKNVVQNHEVLWRGTVYRIRTTNFKKLKNFTARVCLETENLDIKKRAKK